jgi:ABC-type transport system involved in multi-copper enzyme maturation permease subunit
MTDTLNKIIQVSLYVILGVTVILFALFYINGESMANTVMYWAYVLLAITVVLLLAFPIKHFIEYPKQGIKTLIALVAFFALYGISYAFASGSTDAAIYEVNGISENISRAIGAGMIMTYIIGALALVGLVYFAVAKVFK